MQNRSKTYLCETKMSLKSELHFFSLFYITLFYATLLPFSMYGVKSVAMHSILLVMEQ